MPKTKYVIPEYMYLCILREFENSGKKIFFQRFHKLNIDNT